VKRLRLDLYVDRFETNALPLNQPLSRHPTWRYSSSLLHFLAATLAHAFWFFCAKTFYFFSSLAKTSYRRSFLMTYLMTVQARNVFTVPLITLLQIGQCDRDFEHISQVDRCPHGRNTILISLSMQTLHVLASFSLRFSSSSATSSLFVCCLSTLSAFGTPAAEAVELTALVGRLSSKNTNR